MSLRSILDWLYLTPERALEQGFSHHGTLYGIPAWVAPHPSEPYALYGAPKVPLLVGVAFALDVLHEAWCRLTMYEGEVRMAPVHMTAPIIASRGRTL